MSDPTAPEDLAAQEDSDEFEKTWAVELQAIPPRPYGVTRRRVLWDSYRHGGREDGARAYYERLAATLRPPASTVGPDDPAWQLQLVLMGPEVEERCKTLGRFRTQREVLVAYHQTLDQMWDQREPSSSIVGSDDNNEGLLGLLPLPCGRPLGHRSAFLSQPPLRFIHCLDACPRLRGEPRKVRYVTARKLGYISCPRCGHASQHIEIDDARQVLMRADTADLRRWLRDAGRPAHSPTLVSRITAVQAELMVRAEIERPWWYGDTWLDRFLETGEEPPRTKEELDWMDDAKANANPEAPAARADRFLSDDYAVQDGRMCHRRFSRETKSFVWEPLVNGSIRIDRKLRLDDGAKLDDGTGVTTTQLELIARRDDGTVLEPAPLLVSGADFPSLGWLSKAWAAELRVRPTLSARDHLRAAIETLSESQMKHARIFTHTGWREIGGHLHYLTASGALGRPDITVRLNPPLDRYRLPAVPAGVPEAVRQSLRLLTIAPRAVTLPLLAAVYRAPLAHFVPTNFTLWILGKTGAKKSTVAALFLNHFGDFADKEQLPANWSSTGNALLQALFTAKDTMTVLDDFSRDRADPRVLDAIGAQILRAQGNLAGRGRLRADLSDQPQRPPRGLLVVTGEDFPGGESLAARALTSSLEPGMVNLERLTRAQESGRREQLRHALAGYLLWQTERAANGLRKALWTRFHELRAEFRAEPHPDDDGGVPHDRTPEILAHLALGVGELATFAEACGTLSPAEAADVRAQGITDLKALASGQTRRGAAQKPAIRFLSFLTTMLAQRRAQLLKRGKSPSEARVPPALYGWEDGDYWLLLGDAVYGDWAASCNATHEPLPSRDRLWEELVVEGLVEPSREKGRARRTTTVVKIAGQPHRILMLKRDAAAAILGLESLDAASDDPPAPEPSRYVPF